MPESKYYNTYPYGEDQTDHIRGTLGTATKETLKKVGNGYGAWNKDRSALVYSSYAWVGRGGRANLTASAGVFAFYGNTGGAYSFIGFRLVLINE